MNYRVKKEMGCRRESDEFPTHCTCCGEHMRGDSRDLFLWINISEDAGDDLINEYSLKRRC